MHHFVPLVCVHVHHGTEKFNLQICVFSAVLRHNDVLLEVALKSLYGRWRKLGDVATHFEKEGVVKLDCTVNQFIKLLVLGETLRITTVRREIDGKCNQLLPNDRFWAVNDQLVHNRDTFCVSESSLSLILQREVI